MKLILEIDKWDKENIAETLRKEFSGTDAKTILNDARIFVIKEDDAWENDDRYVVPRIAGIAMDSEDEISDFMEMTDCNRFVERLHDYLQS